jgi:competence protein CoiA
VKFADVEGNDREAQPGLAGKCRDCGHVMVVRCGQHRAWHWAHKKSKDCDPWWEQETDWHRSWKNQFPVAWQEIGHVAPSGERHRADVKTESGLVLEFQHSALSEAERISREEFYTPLVWVVDGNKRLRDGKKFFASLSGPLNVASKLPTFSIHREDSVLLRDWGKSRAPVYFDFGEIERIWRLHLFNGVALAYVTPIGRMGFVKAHRDGDDLEGVFDRIFAQDREIATAQNTWRPLLPGFPRYQTRRTRRL